MSKMPVKIIIVDIDGTLADVKHRLKHVRGERKNWKAFFEGMPDDGLNEWCWQLMDHLNTQHLIYLVTGRPDDYKKETLYWLQKHKVPYNKLFMRRAGDRRPDTITKKEILHEQILGERNSFIDHPVTKDDILFVVDDRTSVVNMWRDEGLTCLQCAQFDG